MKTEDNQSIVQSGWCRESSDTESWLGGYTNWKQARPTQLAARCYASTKAAPTEVSSILEERIRGVSDEANLNETGRVLSVGYVYIEYWLMVVDCVVKGPGRGFESAPDQLEFNKFPASEKSHHHLSDQHHTYRLLY